MTDANAIDALQWENRRFPPSEEFKRQALVAGTFLYDEAAADDQGFWARQAADLLDWDTEWHTICEWDLPFAKWFVGGQLNVSYNCLDRHVARRPRRQGRVPLGGRAGRHADGHLRRAARRGAAVRQRPEGARRRAGDRVNIYLPMIPEAAVAMLACARIGAAHSVVFGGFCAQSLRDRINDAEAKVLITADGGYRRGDVFPLKPVADEALRRHAHRSSTSWSCAAAATTCRCRQGRDHWYHDLMADRRPGLPGRADGRRAAALPALHVGHDGQAEGHHAHHGRLPHAGRVHPQVRVRPAPDDDVYWCTADVGWITGHSYIVYGPLANGATQVMYEGVPNHPGNDRFWEIIEKYRVTMLLHGADGDPHLHEVGRRGAGQARPVVAAAARLRR